MKIVIGNWKMHLTIKESIALSKTVVATLHGKTSVPEVVICPSFVALSDVQKTIGKSRVHLGAQDMFWEVEGAFTGEVSSKQLKDVGCKYVIVGHSERRAQFGENDLTVNKKVIAALEAGITPIICVGETREDRKSGRAKEVVVRQVKAALDDLHTRNQETLIFAYEPIWAIGSGTPSTPDDAVEMHKLIKKTAEAAVYGIKPKQIRVLYGGSVDEQLAPRFLREQEIDGVLVGGASLKAAAFEGIVEAAMDASH